MSENTDALAPRVSPLLLQFRFYLPSPVIVYIALGGHPSSIDGQPPANSRSFNRKRRPTSTSSPSSGSQSRSTRKPMRKTRMSSSKCAFPALYLRDRDLNQCSLLSPGGPSFSVSTVRLRSGRNEELAMSVSSSTRRAKRFALSCDGIRPSKSAPITSVRYILIVVLHGSNLLLSL